MRAMILLKTNPGFQKDAYALLKRISVKDVKVNAVMHLFGRFDGVVMCESTGLKSLGNFAEALRRRGVFHTETLIAID